MISIDLSNTVTTYPDPPAARPRRPLLTPLPTPGHFLLVLDNTSFEQFTSCPTKAKYYLVDRREAHVKSGALTFGGALHEGLEKFLLSQYYRVTKPGYFISDDYSEEKQNQAILRYFTENPAPPDEYRTPANCLEVLKHYRFRATLPDYEWQILADSEGPIVERAFELPLGTLDLHAEVPCLPDDGPTWEHRYRRQGADGGDDWVTETRRSNFVLSVHIAWSGRIDALVFYNGLNRVNDHKTTSIAGDTFTQSFRLSNQTLGYVWAAQQLWPEFAPSGFCLNAIHFKKPTGTGSIADPGSRGGPPALNFFRACFDYSPERLEEWKRNALTVISDFLHCLVRNEYPLFTNQCFGKYGKCSYHDVCSLDDPEVRRKLLHSDLYKSVTWNPTAK